MCASDVTEKTPATAASAKRLVFCEASGMDAQGDAQRPVAAGKKKQVIELLDKEQWCCDRATD